jgi:hypothetical protein
MTHDYTLTLEHIPPDMRAAAAKQFANVIGRDLCLTERFSIGDVLVLTASFGLAWSAASWISTRSAVSLVLPSVQRAQRFANTTDQRILDCVTAIEGWLRNETGLNIEQNFMLCELGTMHVLTTQTLAKYEAANAARRLAQACSRSTSTIEHLREPAGNYVVYAGAASIRAACYINSKKRCAENTAQRADILSMAPPILLTPAANNRPPSPSP